jgi:arylsulfatase A-like enzyme
MNRRDLLKTVGLGTAAFGLPACANVAGLSASRRRRQPNIVFIMADDLGYGDVGSCDSESKIPTPTIDGLALGGIRFTDAHSPSAVCTPTRYGLLTGRYCWRTGLKSGVIEGDGAQLIETTRLTLASMLKSHGYSTACIGKWHLGLGWIWQDGREPEKGTTWRSYQFHLLIADNLGPSFLRKQESTLLTQYNVRFHRQFLTGIGIKRRKRDRLLKTT